LLFREDSSLVRSGEMISSLLWLSPAARELLQTAAQQLKGAVPCPASQLAKALRGASASDCEGLFSNKEVLEALAARLEKGGEEISDAGAVRLVEAFQGVLEEQVKSIQDKAVPFAKKLPAKGMPSYKALCELLPKGTQPSKTLLNDWMVWHACGNKYDAAACHAPADKLMKDRLALVACAGTGPAADCAIALHVIENVDAYVAWEQSFPASNPQSVSRGLLAPLDENSAEAVAIRRILSRVLPVAVATVVAAEANAGSDIRGVLVKLTENARKQAIIPFYVAPPAPAEKKEGKDGGAKGKDKGKEGKDSKKADKVEKAGFVDTWSPTGSEMPPGHTQYSWLHQQAKGMRSDGFVNTWVPAKGEFPPGHTDYSWQHAIAVAGSGSGKKAALPKQAAKSSPKQQAAAAPKAAAAAAGGFSGDTEAQIKKVGDAIRTLKEKLKEEGLSGKKISDYADVKRLVDELQGLKAGAPAAAPAAAAASASPKQKAAGSPKQKPASAPAVDLDAEITKVGDDIRVLKEKLKSEGLSGKNVNDHAEVKGLVAKLQELKAQPKAEAAAPASPKGSPKQKAEAKKKGKKGAAEEAPGKELTPEEAAAARKALLKKVMKAGGKRGVEIEGAADMGGLGYFCTSVDEPNGDLEMMDHYMTAMNEKSDPTEEERKGGSGEIGKMIFSAGTDQLALLAYVPASKKKECNATEWLTQVLALFQGEMCPGASETLAKGFVKSDHNVNKFPLKMKEPSITEAITFLKKKGLFPDKDDDSDDDFVFGDDDFPS